MTAPRTDVGNAIRAALVSPNELDSNLEPANVVDGLFAIARAVGDLADAIRAARPSATEPRRLCDVACPQGCTNCLPAVSDPWDGS